MNDASKDYVNAATYFFSNVNNLLSRSKFLDPWTYIKVYNCTGPIIITNGAYTAPLK